MDLDLISFGESRLLSRCCQPLTDQPRQTFNLLCLYQRHLENQVNDTILQLSACLAHTSQHLEKAVYHHEGRQNMIRVYALRQLQGDPESSWVIRLRLGDCHLLMLYVYNECWASDAMRCLSHPSRREKSRRLHTPLPPQRRYRLQNNLLGWLSIHFNIDRSLTRTGIFVLCL
jgi:hypothetical protein